LAKAANDGRREHRRDWGSRMQQIVNLVDGVYLLTFATRTEGIIGVIRVLIQIGSLPRRTNDRQYSRAAAIRGSRGSEISIFVLRLVALVPSTRSSGARYAPLPLAYANHAQQTAEDLVIPVHLTC
jgi:hypothetical protein